MNELPEVELSSAEIRVVESIREQFADLAGLENAALTDHSFRRDVRERLGRVRERVLAEWTDKAHVVLRRVPPSDDGSTGLIVAMCSFAVPKPYRGGQVVKHFRMSPWTKALSHTLAAGFFHTDINTADAPPAATLMQCLEPDPGAPVYGQLRVVAADELLAYLRAGGYTQALRLLEEVDVTMVNETSPSGWRGRIVSDGAIRFHPESLRAAQQQFASNPASLEEDLATIHEAALALTRSINLGRGDVLMVSNRRALHQRGACTVRFRQYPREFDARSVAVLHAIDEPS